MRKRTRSRELALQALYQIDLTGVELAEAIADMKASNQLGDADSQVRDYAQKLINGCYQKCDDLDQSIERYAENWKMDRMAYVDRNILRLSCYEIMFCKDIPAKVSINEAIELAKKFGDADSPKFVNGILDKIAKENGLDKDQ